MAKQTRVCRRRYGRKTRKQRGGKGPKGGKIASSARAQGPSRLEALQQRRNFAVPLDTYTHEQFVIDMQTMPIYMINTHGSICVSYEECERKPPLNHPIKRIPTDYSGSFADKFPVFRIPRSTYILNLTGGGEYCIALPDLTQIMIDNKTQIRNFFLLDDRTDTILPAGPKFPLLYSSKRATDTLYPDMMLTLKDPDSQTGVFELTKMKLFKAEKITNMGAILIPEASEKKDWLLSEIIEEVYRIRGDRRGIFIIAACSSAAEAHNNIQVPVGALDIASNMIRYADQIYSGQVPVLSKETLGDSVPVDPGYNTSPTVIAIESAAAFAKTMRVHPQNIYNPTDASMFHPNVGGVNNVAALAGMRPRLHPPLPDEDNNL
jgi:hypothetical protein